MLLNCSKKSKMAQSNKAKLHENLSCSLCLEVYNHKDRLPKALPCQHNVCLACLGTYVDGCIQAGQWQGVYLYLESKSNSAMSEVKHCWRGNVHYWLYFNDTITSIITFLYTSMGTQQTIYFTKVLKIKSNSVQHGIQICYLNTNFEILTYLFWIY